MLFSSINFLYYFLPCVCFLYFVVPYKCKNVILLLGSLLFYFYGEPKFILLMLLQVVVAYAYGILIEKFSKYKKVFFILAILSSLSALVLFKYADFIISNINDLFKTNFKILNLALPIGISFYTFQILSYIIDSYKGKVPVQKSFIKLTLYVTLFPQLIAGPIVRYIDVEKELTKREHSFEKFALGIR